MLQCNHNPPREYVPRLRACNLFKVLLGGGGDYCTLVSDDVPWLMRQPLSRDKEQPNIMELLGVVRSSPIRIFQKKKTRTKQVLGTVAPQYFIPHIW